MRYSVDMLHATRLLVSIACCALALAAGAGYADAAVLANIAAGFVGDEIGTVAVPADKLKQRLEGEP